MSPNPGGTLVIQTAFLGDVVLTTGLLNELARRYGPVDVVTTPAALPLVETHPAVRTAIPYAKAGEDRGLSGLIRVAARLRRARYARAFLPHRSLRSGTLAWLAGIDDRIGFAGSPGAWTYTRKVPWPATEHEAERLLSLAEPPAGTRASITLGLTPDDHAEADGWLARRSVPAEFAVMAPGSVWGTKQWPYYPELAAGIQLPVVVIGNAVDRVFVAEGIQAAAPDRVFVAAGELSLRGSAALIGRAAVLISNDSAPVHLAAAVGTPTVAIFGPTIPAFGFGPRGRTDQIVQRDGLACRPCSSHGPQVCPLGHHHCMREISSDHVRRVLAGMRGTG